MVCVTSFAAEQWISHHSFLPSFLHWLLSFFPQSQLLTRLVCLVSGKCSVSTVQKSAVAISPSSFPAEVFQLYNYNGSGDREREREAEKEGGRERVSGHWDSLHRLPTDWNYLSGCRGVGGCCLTASAPCLCVNHLWRLLFEFTFTVVISTCFSVTVAYFYVLPECVCLCVSRASWRMNLLLRPSLTNTGIFLDFLSSHLWFCNFRSIFYILVSI